MSPRSIALARRPKPHPLGPEEARDVWVEVPVDDDWIAAFRVFTRSGQLIVGELRVFPNEGDEQSFGGLWSQDRPPGTWSAEIFGDVARVPEGGLTARRARKAPFLEALSAFREVLARIRLDEGQEEELIADLVAHGITESARATRRPGAKGGHPKTGDARLAEIARAYVRLSQESARPMETLAEKRGYSLGHTKRLVGQARSRGLLTPPERRGRAGGQLTEKAVELLEARRESGS